MAERSMLVFTGSRKSRLDGLKALRDKLGRQIDECESNRDLAALAARHMDVLAAIAELESSAVKSAGPAPKTGVADIGAKRAERLAARKGA